MKLHFASVRRSCRSVQAALVDHVRSLPPSLRACTAGVLLVFALSCLLTSTVSCAHTKAGLAREQAMYQAGTNVVGTLQSIAPYVPAPAGQAAEIVLAVVSTLLASWNLHQQQELKKLKNGNGNGNGNKGVAGLALSAKTPGTPQQAP